MVDVKGKKSVAAFLETVAAERPAQRCVVCDDKRISAVVDEILAARKAGKTTVSSVRVHAWLRDEYGATFSVSTLLLCCRVHRGTPWHQNGK